MNKRPKNHEEALAQIGGIKLPDFRGDVRDGFKAEFRDFKNLPDAEKFLNENYDKGSVLEIVSSFFE